MQRPLLDIGKSHHGIVINLLIDKLRSNRKASDAETSWSLFSLVHSRMLILYYCCLGLKVWRRYGPKTKDDDV